VDFRAGPPQRATIVAVTESASESRSGTRDGVGDPRWPRAADWLAAGPGDRVVDLALLGVPAFATSLSPTGAQETPGAVRAALARFGTWSTTRAIDLADVAPLDLGDVPDPDGPGGEGRTGKAVAAAVTQARLLAALGGDNSITFAVTLGAARGALATAGLVTLDAHHDLRDGRSNGSPVRRLVDAGLDPTRIVQVGIADWANSPQYARRAADLGITVLSRDRIATQQPAEWMRAALGIAGRAGGPVHVDLDVDVCDRAVAPACPASLPGGISAYELRAAAFLAASDRRVSSLDITEVDATADTSDGRTVRLAALCVLEAAAGLASRPAASADQRRDA
jgi:formiminoglutamase